MPQNLQLVGRIEAAQGPAIDVRCNYLPPLGQSPMGDQRYVLVAEAQTIVGAVLAAPTQQPEIAPRTYLQEKL